MIYITTELKFKQDATTLHAGTVIFKIPNMTHVGIVFPEHNTNLLVNVHLDIHKKAPSNSSLM